MTNTTNFLFILLLVSPLAIFVFLKQVSCWKSHLNWMICFMPFIGIICIWFPILPNPTIVLDILFVIPIYLGVLAFSKNKLVLSIAVIPPTIRIVLLALLLLIIFQLGNLNTTNNMVMMIGLKVWVFYIPMLIIGIILALETKDLEKFLKFWILGGVLSIVFGIIIFISGNVIGIYETTYFIYGESSKAATQNYVSWDTGILKIFRVPSTFPFVSQYYGFLMACFVPAYHLYNSKNKKNKFWGKWFLSLVIIGHLTCGQRAVVVFLPLQLFLTLLIDKKIRFALFIRPHLYFFMFSLMGVVIYYYENILSLYNNISFLIIRYFNMIIVGGVLEALNITLFGMGLGSNTGAARHASEFTKLEVTRLALQETYYMKVWVELGIIGLLLLITLFYLWIVNLLKIRKHLEKTEYASFISAVCGLSILIFLTSFKGWYFDLMPLNFLLWILLGVSIGLNYNYKKFKLNELK